MRIGLGLGIPFKKNYVAAIRSFNPSSLFANGEQGAWYDPSDRSTMFQDSAGTTPVTAVEQPVGLILDKSKGLVLGPELVVNGTFDTNIESWTQTAGAILWSAGTLQCGTGSSGRATQTLTLTPGVTYQISVTVVTFGTNGIVRLGTDSTGATGSVLSISGLATGTYNYRVAASASTMYLSLASVSQSNFDNISVRELPGNHATQTTSTSRPVLSARVNLLTKTEQFDDAVWVKSNATVTTNSAIAPDGTLTADKVVDSTTDSSHLVYQTQTTPSGVSLVASVYLKAGELGYAGIQMFSGARPTVLVNLSTGALSVFGTSPAAFSSTNAGNGWWRVSITATTGATSSTVIVFPSNSATPANQNNQARYIGNGTDGIYICGADLRVANDGVGLPAYQRVNTSTDYDTTGFPLYLKFDGVDDFLVTNSINFTATDKMTVFAGVRKLSDAARGMVVELSATLASNNGCFALNAPDPVYEYSFSSRGTSAQNALVDSAEYAAPITNVLTGIGNISGDSAILRINGTQAASSTADQGAGNYGNYPLYIGRRGGSQLPAAVRLHSLIVRGAQSTAAQIAATETYVNSKTKAYV